MNDRIARALAPLPPEERQQWTDTLDRNWHSCGCAEGMIGLLLGIVAGVALSHAAGPWSVALWAVGGAVMGAVLGKGLGMARGRLLALRQLTRLEREL